MILLPGLICIFHLSAQENASPYISENIEEKSFDEKKWEQTIEGLDYYPKPEKEKKEKERDMNLPPSSFFDLGQGFKIFLYGAFILILGFLVFHLLRGSYGLKSGKVASTDQIDIELIADKIHESDLERFLREALGAGNYRLAIRLYYLIIIKELSVRNWIFWKKEKTNLHYLMEMSQKELFPSFRTITRIFEKVWYGEAEVNQPDFKSLEPIFEKFIQDLRK